MIEIRKDLFGNVFVAGLSCCLLEHSGLLSPYLLIERALQNQNRLTHFADRRQRIISPEFLNPWQARLRRIFGKIAPRLYGVNNFLLLCKFLALYFGRYAWHLVETFTHLVHANQIATFTVASHQNDRGDFRIACCNHWRDHAALAVARQRDSFSIYV